MRAFFSIATATLLTMFASANVPETAGDSANSIRTSDKDFVPPEGIAGSGFSENFEVGFAYGACPQNGWSCSEVIDHPHPSLGAYSMQDRSINALPPLVGSMRSPNFVMQTGLLSVDVVINDNTSVWHLMTVSYDPNNTNNFFNTRIVFQNNGWITVLQIDEVVPPQCAAGTDESLHLSTAAWTPGVKMRIGIEVLPGRGEGSLRVYKDGVVIFTGHDISQRCAPANPIGMSRVQNFNFNFGNTSTMVADNISIGLGANPCDSLLLSCRADVEPPGGDGVVNIDDLLSVVGTWAQTQVPPGTGPRPRGDCDPPPNGDCAVNIDDLLAVIATWGPCQ